MLSSATPRLLVLFPLLSAVRGDCTAPPKLQNAVPQGGDHGTSFPDGSSVVYKCVQDFYNVHGKLDVTTCLSDSWTPIEEFCERSCPDAPRSRFAQARQEEMRTYYVPAATVTYNCRAAYDRIPEISSVITCLQNYTWTELPEFCKKKSCGEPGNPENGRAIIQTDLLYSSKVNFICNDGYRLIGSHSTECVLKGKEVKWNKELPNCEQITCVSPPTITSGTHNGTNGTFAYHSTITYKCDDGFSLIGEASLTCITEYQINGVWNGSAPECRRNTTPQGDCNRPNPIKYAELSRGQLQDSYPVKTILTYRCIRGYELIRGIVPQITCSDASEWVPEAPQFCQGRRCPSPDIENGRIVSSTDLRLGDQITFACDVGYRLIGRDTARCTLSAGTVDWDYQPSCQRIPCFPPPPIANGRKTGDDRADYDYGSTVTYSCDAGFSLIGKKALVCGIAADGINGEWDSNPPECKVVQCPRPEIAYGSISSFQPSYAYDHALMITCDAGYSLSGASLIKCGADNNWHPSLPTCVFGTTTTTASTTVPSEDVSTKAPTDKPASTKAPTDKPGSTMIPKDEPGTSNVLAITLGLVGLLILVAVIVLVVYNRAHRPQGETDTSTSAPDSYRVVPQNTDMVLEEKKASPQV